VSQRRRPGRLWLFFYGRPRRGFPWLLAGIVVTILVLSLTFAIPGGADVWRGLAPVFLVVLIAGAVVAAVILIRNPRRRP